MLEAVGGTAHALAGLSLLGALLCLAISVSVSVWGVNTPRQFVATAADEIRNYTSQRFLEEPDVWRVHLRSLQALEQATRKAEEDGNAALVAISVSLRAFLGGLGFSLIALGTLIFELI
jgi:hypothetical protein